MLEVKHVCYGIDGVPILKDISLGVQKGCIVTIVGPNGCGKSTLLKIISRILRPQSGEVLLDGCDVRNVVVDLTVEQLVQYGRYPHTGFGGKLTKRDIDKVDEAMHAAGIETLRNRAIGTLSGGESQMAWIAMCLAQAPEIILLDEPTTYLDIGSRFEVMGLARRLAGMGKAVVLVLHDLELVLRYADRVVVMNGGRVKAEGPPDEVYPCLRNCFGVEVCRIPSPEGVFYSFSPRHDG